MGEALSLESRQMMKNNTRTHEFALEHNLLRYTLILSLLIHFVVLMKMSYMSSHQLNKIYRNIEITAYNFKLQTKKAEAQTKKQEAAKDSLDRNAAVLMEKDLIKPSSVKDMSKLANTFGTVEKQPAMIGELHVKRKVSVPALKSEKIQNPLYQNYYQAVRSMIKARAYANYSKLDTGEVYLTFVVLANGVVKQVQLIEEKTSANDYLKDVGFKSIKESNPFPPFPKELNYPELSFNVVISFEVQE